MEPPRPLTDAETKIVRIFKQAAENHAAVKGIKTQWSIYHISREAGLDLSAYPKEGLVVQAVWIAFLSVMKSYTPDCELKYPTIAEFHAAYNNKFEGYNSYELNTLWAIANWMSVLFTFVPSKKNKGFALTIITKMIEGWYIKYVTGSGQTKATNDRVHIFEVEGNTKPSPRGKSAAALKLKSMNASGGTSADDNASVASGSTATSTSTTSTSTASSSPTDYATMTPFAASTGFSRPASPVSSPRSGDQGVGHHPKRRKSVGKSSTAFPAYGPENTLFSMTPSLSVGGVTQLAAVVSGGSLQLGSSPPKSSSVMALSAVAAPQPAPAVQTMLFNSGVGARSNAARSSSKQLSPRTAPQQQSSIAMPQKLSATTDDASTDPYPLLRSISNFSLLHPHPKHPLRAGIIDSGASDMTDDQYITESEDMDDLSLGMDESCFYDGITGLTPRTPGWKESSLNIVATDASDVNYLTLDDHATICAMEEAEDNQFQEMLRLLRETSTSSMNFRQTSLHMNNTSSSCFLLDNNQSSMSNLSPDKAQITFAAVPVDVPLNELGPPLAFPYSAGLNGLGTSSTDSYSPKLPESKSFSSLLSVDFKFGQSTSAFDVFDHEFF